MTDNTETSGTETGQSDATQTSGTAGTPSNVTQDQVMGWINEAMETQRRKQQSSKDKGIANLQGEVSELRKTIARLNEIKQSGYSDEQAIDRLELEQRIANLEGRPITETSQDNGGSEAQVTTLDPNILKAFNLDPAEARVADAFENVDANDPAAVLRAVAGLVSGKGKSANEGQRMSADTGGSADTETIDSVSEALNDLMRNPSKNMKRIIELQGKLKQLHADSIE